MPPDEESARLAKLAIAIRKEHVSLGDVAATLALLERARYISFAEAMQSVERDLMQRHFGPFGRGEFPFVIGSLDPFVPSDRSLPLELVSISYGSPLQITIDLTEMAKDVGAWVALPLAPRFVSSFLDTVVRVFTLPDEIRASRAERKAELAESDERRARAVRNVERLTPPARQAESKLAGEVRAVGATLTDITVEPSSEEIS